MSKIIKRSLLLASTVVMVATAQAATPVCSALVKLSDDLYLMRRDGSRLAQFSHDRQDKVSATLSSDGSKVAFIPSARPDTFEVTNLTGGRNIYMTDALSTKRVRDDHGDPSNTPGAPLVGLQWASGDTIRLEKHIGKDTSRFEFYRVPSNLSSNIQSIGGSVIGTICVLAPNKNQTACLLRDDVTVDGKTVYSDMGIADSIEQDFLVLKVGETALVKRMPGLQIKVKSIEAGLTLRANLPSGNWSESRVRDGGFMNIPMQTGSLKIFPKLIDAKTGEVKLTIRSSKTPSRVYGRALSWTPDGNGLVVVKRMAKGNALTLLKSSNQLGWKQVGEVPVGIEEAIRMIRFVQPGLMYFETSTRSGLAPLTLPSSRQSLRLGQMSYFPKNVGHSSNKEAVLGWACR